MVRLRSEPDVPPPRTRLGALTPRRNHAPEVPGGRDEVTLRVMQEGETSRQAPGWGALPALARNVLICLEELLAPKPQIG
jgi:hypothetical protein